MYGAGSWTEILSDGGLVIHDVSKVKLKIRPTKSSIIYMTLTPAQMTSHIMPKCEEPYVRQITSAVRLTLFNIGWSECIL